MSRFQGQPEDFSCDFIGCDDDHSNEEDQPVAAIKDDTVMIFCSIHCQRLVSAGIVLRTVIEADAVLRLNRALSNDSDELTAEAEFIRELKIENY
jgi:hypothetical protein